MGALEDYAARAAYMEFATHFGKELPDWEALSENHKQAWRDAAAAACGKVMAAEEPESLLAAALDKINRNSRTNAMAITKIQEAILWLRYGGNV